MRVADDLMGALRASLDRAALVRHLRDAHPNLLTESGTPLPRTRLSDVSMERLTAVHDANHAPRYREHDYDDWLTRRPVEGGPDA